jgi:phage gp46-like protein
MIETFVSVDGMQLDTVDSHIWTIGGVDYVRTQDLNILDLDEDGLRTALIISLFTDRRLPFAGNAPSVKDDRRGWWGDNTLATNDRIGSRLWTLAREKTISNIIIPKAEQIIREALQWLLDDGVAQSVSVLVTKTDNYTLSFFIGIQKPQEEKTSPYNFLWRNV